MLIHPTDRHIRIFVSSTFRDMQEERDYLVKYTFPQLRKLCELRGIVWGEVDLRWGITDEATAEGQVLPICLQEIERCRPYFIGLLGERYGWVPDTIPADLIEHQPWLRDYRQRSVTELEMLHGVSRKDGLPVQALFYFRDPAYLDRLPAGSQRAEYESESPDAYASLTALKDWARRAKAEGLCRVREPYPDPETLGRWILDDFTVLINERFPEGSQLDTLEQEAHEHEVFARSRVKVYIERQEYFDRLNAHVAGEGPPLIVLGESGSGKSAILANWFFRHHKANPETTVLIHFIGATPYSADWAAMLRRVLGEFKRRFDLHEEIPTDAAGLRSTFANWLQRAAAKGKVVLILDALNQLEDREGAPDLVWLPTIIPARVRLIISALPGRVLENLTKRKWPTCLIRSLEDDERRALITEYLGSHSKSLNEARMTRIVSALQTANPLYLRILCDELRQHGSHETLDQTIGHYLTAITIPDLYTKVLGRWERDYGGCIELVSNALSLLWTARRGISETEWRELLGTDGQPLPQASLAPFLLAMEASLVSRSGLFTFAHDYLREAVQAAYVSTERHSQAVHRKLADYFQAQPLTTRHIDERPWQLAEMAEWGQLAHLLREEAFLLQAWRANEYDVRRYWVRVEKHSAERLAETYRTVRVPTEGEGETTFPHVVAFLLQTTGHLHQAKTMNESLLIYERKSGGPAGFAQALGNQAATLRALGNLDEAMRLLVEQEQVCREWVLGDSTVANSLGNQATILTTWGDLENAVLPGFPWVRADIKGSGVVY